MTDVEAEQKVEQYEHFFRDPKVGDGILQPMCKGIACRNLRDALRHLGYPIADGDQYDDELKQAVLRFQADHGHPSRDGLVGPGTRKRLTKAILLRSENFFRRGRVSPEYAVFLSYSRKDEGRIDGLLNGLRAHGIPVFRDKEAIPGGASWPDVLFRSIQKCQVFLCLLTPESAGSVNVLLEVALARHADRPILPVLLSPAQLPAALGALLNGVQYLDLHEHADAAEGFPEVLEAIGVFGVKGQP